METILFLMIGYLIGSIPFALVIGKVFYKTDIRTQGSGNLGGTNAGRVLGKKAGIAVSILDVLKATFAIFLCYIISVKLFNANGIAAYAGLGALIGHCYPVFAQFKGGKAVSVGFGLLLALTPKLFLLTFIVWLLVMKLSKMVSLSSMIAFVFASIYSIFTYTLDNNVTTIVIFATILMIYRHRSNISRIIKKQESKVSWL